MWQKSFFILIIKTSIEVTFFSFQGMFCRVAVAQEVNADNPVTGCSNLHAKVSLGMNPKMLSVAFSGVWMCVNVIHNKKVFFVWLGQCALSAQVN